jgi:hypothetical protein
MTQLANENCIRLTKESSPISDAEIQALKPKYLIGKSFRLMGYPVCEERLNSKTLSMHLNLPMRSVN